MAKTQKSTLEEAKELILWAKSNKIKKIRVGDIEVEFSDIALMDTLASPQDFKEATNYAQRTLLDTEKLSKEEEDELLFWSTKR